MAALAGAAFITARCARARSLDPLRANSLLLSWSAAAVVVFGASAIHYQQYFQLVLIPWTACCGPKCAAMSGPSAGVPGRDRGGLLIVTASLATFYFRVLDRDNNVLRQVQGYARHEIPRRSIVLTSEEIGDEIPQPWCTPACASRCGAATYAITYTSYLEPAAPTADRAFWALMARATRITTFRGFKETVTVWRLAGRGRAG